MDKNLFPLSNLNNTDLNNLLKEDKQHHFPLHVIDNLIYDPFK